MMVLILLILAMICLASYNIYVLRSMNKDNDDKQ